jgi:glucokinase
MTIRLLAGATVAESPDLADFDPYERLNYDPECDRETSDFAVALFAGRDIEDVTILGPGTGLGVAHVLRHEDRNHVIECEGGHIGYAPLDSIEDAMLARLRRRYRRVSVERIVSGPGLANIYEALAAIEGRSVEAMDDKALWAAALSGEDGLAAVALDRFCMILGSVAGDIALSQGAKAVIIAGGLGQRLVDVLPRSGFASRFTAKGRFEPMMAAIPVKVITHPQPGLFGAAAAFAEEHSR